MVRQGSRASLLPERGNQADNVHPQTLLAQRRALQLRCGSTAPLAPGTGAGDVNVLGNLHRHLGQIDHFPSTLGPAAGQLGPAVGTLLHHMLHPLGGRHAGPGETVGPRLAGLLGLGRFPVGFGLQARHPSGAFGFGPPFRLGDPLLQPFDDGLLPEDDVDQHIPVGGGEVDFMLHGPNLT